MADPFQAEVAQLALEVSAQHGFALGGGQALILHGVVDRPTEDIDLFTDDDAGVVRAAGAVQRALKAAGLDVADVPSPAGLADVFDGFDLGMVEWEVCRGDLVVRLTLARMHRGRSPVVMHVGPVMHIDDVVGSKVAAMVGRGEVRDFVDVAASLDRYTLDELITLARGLDPALTDEDFTDAGRRLDTTSDERFVHFGLTGEQVSQLRLRLADWPRP